MSSSPFINRADPFDTISYSSSSPTNSQNTPKKEEIIAKTTPAKNIQWAISTPNSNLTLSTGKRTSARRSNTENVSKYSSITPSSRDKQPTPLKSAQKQQCRESDSEIILNMKKAPKMKEPVANLTQAISHVLISPIKKDHAQKENNIKEVPIKSGKKENVFDRLYNSALKKNLDNR